MPAEFDDEALLEKLARLDELSRAQRLARHKWVAQYLPEPAAYQSSLETIELMAQARVSYVNGQFIAAVMLAAAFVEHSLAGELAGRGLSPKKNGFADLVEAATNNNLLPVDVLEETSALGKLRNPYAHRFDPEDESRYAATLSGRFQSSTEVGRPARHPLTVMEADAQMALKLMYEYFNLTLKR